MSTTTIFMSGPPQAKIKVPNILQVEFWWSEKFSYSTLFPSFMGGALQWHGCRDSSLAKLWFLVTVNVFIRVIFIPRQLSRASYASSFLLHIASWQSFSKQDTRGVSLVTGWLLGYNQLVLPDWGMNQQCRKSSLCCTNTSYQFTVQNSTVTDQNFWKGGPSTCMEQNFLKKGGLDRQFAAGLWSVLVSLKFASHTGINLVGGGWYFWGECSPSPSLEWGNSR